jgi:hypothetical protein
MRYGPALLVAVVGLAACGSSRATDGPIVAGITGGNLRPFSVTIEPNGSVQTRGPAPLIQRRHIPQAAVRRLRDEIAAAALHSRVCAGALPDVAAQYIRVGGTTITVRGGAARCEPAFARTWVKLFNAVGAP